MVDIYAHPGESLAIGRRGENDARRVAFDLAAWRGDYGEGTVQLLHQRAGDESPYPCALTVEGDTAYWLIRAADVDKAGWGSAQLHYYVGDTLAKSAIWRTVTADALSDPSEPPEDPARAWFAAIREQIGNLDELTTEAKDNLVAAINEAAKTGSGFGSVSMRVSGGYIQYSADGGASWDNLIATADLRGAKGDPGTDGTDGKDGITPHIGDNGNWYLGGTDTGKPSRGATGPAGADGKAGGQGPKGDIGEPGPKGPKGDPGTDGTDGKDGITPHIGDNGNWYLGGTDTGKPSRGATGPAGADGKDGGQGPKGDPGATPNLQIGTVTTLEAGEAASASISGTPEEPRLNLGIPKGAQGEAGSGGGADLSLGLAGVSKWQSPIIKAVDSDGKPTEWEAAALAKADGSNVPTDARDTWRTRIAALPGMKVYGKADANGKIMAYTDAACTQAATYTVALGLQEYGNALLIYDHKTYQCVGFSEYPPIPGAFIVAHFSRSEIVTTDNTSVYHVEHAVLDIMGYLSGTIDAPIKITAGDIPLTNITTT